MALKDFMWLDFVINDNSTIRINKGFVEKIFARYFYSLKEDIDLREIVIRHIGPLQLREPLVLRVNLGLEGVEIQDRNKTLHEWGYTLDAPLYASVTDYLRRVVLQELPVFVNSQEVVELHVPKLLPEAVAKVGILNSTYLRSLYQSNEGVSVTMLLHEDPKAAEFKLYQLNEKGEESALVTFKVTLDSLARSLSNHYSQLSLQNLLPYITLVFENVEIMGLTNVPINLAWDAGGYLIEFMGAPIGHAKSVNEAFYIIAEYVQSRASNGELSLGEYSSRLEDEADEEDWDISVGDLSELIKDDEEVTDILKQVLDE